MEDILVPIASMIIVFGSLFGILYLYFTTRNRERMAMIEKGIGSEIFNSRPKARFTYWALKIGMLIFGIGIGLFVAVFLDPIFQKEMEKIVVYWGLVLTFGGLGLITSFLIERKMTK